MDSLSPQFTPPSSSSSDKTLTPINSKDLINVVNSQKNHLNFFFQNLDVSQTLNFTQTLLDAKGKVFFTGVGESEYVARTISLTLGLLRIQSEFISHDDGYTNTLSKSDVLVFFCKPGDSDKLLRLVTFAKGKGVFVVSVTLISGTSKEGDSLEGVCDLNVHLPLCPYNLGSANSTTILMVFCDTVAALVGARDSTKDEKTGILKMGDGIELSPELAPKQMDTPEEPTENTLSKTTAWSARGASSTFMSVNAKRKSGSDDVKAANGTPPAKKVETEHNSKSSVIDGSASAPKGGSVLNAVQPSAVPVTEDEIRAFLLQKPSVTTLDLVVKFKARLKSPKDKVSFAEIVKKIAKIQKGSNFLILREEPGGHQ